MAPLRHLVTAAVLLLATAAGSEAQLRFSDDFEATLEGWELTGEHAITIQDSGDAEHGKVMVLEPDGPVFALIKASEQWGPVRLELDVFFPDDKDNYLGLIYNYRRSIERSDFGSLYIKGNGSYIRANPWRDGNVSRLLYEEYKTRIEGNDAIKIGSWHKVKAEIAGRVCHLYIGNDPTPKVTFDLYEGDSGKVGFNPRVAGWPVWIDNVVVTSIKELTYRGPPVPGIKYDPNALITNWQVLGPFAHPVLGIERSGDPDLDEILDGVSMLTWQPFQTDARGAVITGRVTEYDGSRPVAYFRTRVHSETARSGILHLSSADEMALWVNGRFNGFFYRNGYVFGDRDWNVWFDFWKNPKHKGRQVPIGLDKGSNQIVIRVRNGQFASGGFFARLEPKQESATDQ